MTYLDDDGTSVEPIFYVPIVPMILINGSKGIGTGFSTDISCFSIEQIIRYIENKLLDQEFMNESDEFFHTLGISRVLLRIVMRHIQNSMCLESIQPIIRKIRL